METEQVTISVALCTYNGSKYILKQLNSIAEQRCLPSELVVCDDGSTDDTLSIIQEFSTNAPFSVRIYCNETRQGVVRNFEKALSLCCGRYIALCDQDDVWLPNKISEALSILQNAEHCFGEQMPLLVHSDLHVVDRNLTMIQSSFFTMQKIHHEEIDPLKVLLTQNFVTGCTVIMNRCLVNKATPFPENIMMHDWWLALVAASVGKILLAPQINILYRQHGSNQVGANGFYRISNFKKVIKLANMDKLLAGTIVQAMALRNHLQYRLKSPIKDYLNTYIDIVLKGGIGVAFMVHKTGITRQGLIRKCIYNLILSRGKYKAYIDM